MSPTVSMPVAPARADATSLDDTIVPSFEELGLPSSICATLTRKGIAAPFPIQAAVIPDVLSGRDVCGRAPTGSGKTLGFGLPMVTRLVDARRRSPVALVLAPTRELAEQISRELGPYAESLGHRVAAVYGGVGYGGQRKALDQGTELLVACPGRLEDLMSMRAVSLADVTTVVIDEADQMADMGFLPAVRRIVDATSAKRQVLLFSATLAGPVAKLIDDYQTDPARHEVGERGPDITSARHLFWTVGNEERTERVADVVKLTGSSIVFTRTRHGADRLSQRLARLGVRAEPIHGGRSQSQRDRALDAFKRGHATALVATDVAARGVHVQGVASVVHYDPPADAATYLHRSGRTARAGATGLVISLVDHKTSGATKKLQRDVGLAQGVQAPDLSELRQVTIAAVAAVAANDTNAGSAPKSANTTRANNTTSPTRATSPARRTPGAATAKGTISFFHNGKGYGFITRTDGEDIFVHASNVLMEGRPILEIGAGVTFDVREGKRGPEAFDVVPV